MTKSRRRHLRMIGRAGPRPMAWDAQAATAFSRMRAVRETSQRGLIANLDFRGVGYFDNPLVAQFLQRANNSFYGDTKIVGDIAPGHRQHKMHRRALTGGHEAAACQQE